jgi:hypothetical protein
MIFIYDSRMLDLPVSNVYPIETAGIYDAFIIRLLYSFFIVA